MCVCVLLFDKKNFTLIKRDITFHGKIEEERLKICTNPERIIRHDYSSSCRLNLICLEARLP